MDPLVSVIIPVYNVEKYIERCIKSVIAQKNVSIEIIIIDDGSTDNSIEKLKEYKVHGNIKVISTINKGVSAARNLGLLKSKGKYIYFLDADDYIEKNTISKLYTAATTNNTSIAMGGFFAQSNKPENTESFKPTIVYNSAETITKILKNDLPRTSCGILFERSIIIKNNLIFNEDLSYGEDFLFTLNFLSQCEFSSAVFEVTYIVESRNNSASRQNSVNHIENVEKINNILMNLKVENKLGKLDDAFKYFIATEIILSVSKILNSEENVEKKIESIRKVKKFKTYSEINNRCFKENFKTRKVNFKIVLMKTIPARVLLKIYTLTKEKFTKIYKYNPNVKDRLGGIK